MRSSDIIRSIIILLLFSIIYSSIIVSDTILDMNKEWAKYRCNPLFMPFASAFGHSNIDNFKYCVSKISNNNMPDLMGPTKLNIDLLGKMGGNLNTNITSSNGFVSMFRDNIMNSFGSIYGILMGVIAEFYKLSVSMKDVLGKTIGVTRTLVYTLEGSITTMESANDTAFMRSLRKISKLKGKSKGCFSGDTKIKLNTGDYKRIDEIEINDTLEYDTHVLATMKITNITPGTSDMISSVYMIPNGDNDDILVTGSHLIYDNVLGKFVCVRDYRDSIKTKRCLDVVYCLITDNHTIPIGEYIFHDWEDTPNKSKDIVR
uniref:Hedgehog/Intein (Hint) domain-containing protein n=1 Tax=viral metagenome TaxID=1070528 RepID=A0A6C0BT03_9ZZZZ